MLLAEELEFVGRSKDRVRASGTGVLHPFLACGDRRPQLASALTPGTLDESRRGRRAKCLILCCRLSLLLGFVFLPTWRTADVVHNATGKRLGYGALANERPKFVYRLPSLSLL